MSGPRLDLLNSHHRDFQKVNSNVNLHETLLIKPLQIDKDARDTRANDVYLVKQHLEQIIFLSNKLQNPNPGYYGYDNDHLASLCMPVIFPALTDE